MSTTINIPGPDSASRFQNVLDEPEGATLLRMTRLVESLFRAPIAYMALLGPEIRVVTRIGSGSKYWKDLRTFPLSIALAKAGFWPNPAENIAGFVPGDIRFAAWAPLRSTDGLELGLLVIADARPRPDFSVRDCDTLADLATVLAGKMELRMLACQARESELSLREAERRFRNIADSAPVMIIYSGVDGAASFVNRNWLEFTGRSLDEELGDGYADSFHPDYRETVMAAYWDAFQERRALTVEFPMRRRDGAYRWMQARGIPRFLDDGSCCGFIGCFLELSDQRAAAWELRKQGLCTPAVEKAMDTFARVPGPERPIEPMGSRPQCTQERDPGRTGK